MDKVGLVFPGQGSQFVGMGKEIYNELESAKKIMFDANDVLCLDIQSIIFGEDEELLKATEIAQPAIYTVSAMYLEKFKTMGIDFQVVAGHSLGEYSALYAAGVLSFEDGLRLVRKRGLLMANSSNTNGGMAAIMGLDLEKIESIADNFEDLVVANVNSKNQIVISGKMDSIEKSIPKFEKEGATKIVRLNVSGAFHSPLMLKAKEELKKEIDRVHLKEPFAEVFPNVLAKPTKDVELIRESLVQQMIGRVRWMETIIEMKKIGIKKLYEIGPNDVLKRLTMTITSKIKCYSMF